MKKILFLLLFPLFVFSQNNTTTNLGKGYIILSKSQIADGNNYKWEVADSLKMANGSTLADKLVETIQTLTINGNTLEISGGNQVSLPAFGNVIAAQVANNDEMIALTKPNSTDAIIAINSSDQMNHICDANCNPANLSEWKQLIQPNTTNILTITGNTIESNVNGVISSADIPPGEATTVTDGSSIDFTLSGTNITGEVKPGSITSAMLSPSIVVPEVDGSVMNEIQTISLSGSTLSLSNGGGTADLGSLPVSSAVTAAIAASDAADGDKSATNEIQSLSLTGTTLSLSNGGGSVSLPSDGDSNPTNEIQTLSITGNSVSLSNGGGSISLPAEVDGSVTNEIQTISLSGSSLTLSRAGGTVDLSALTLTDANYTAARASFTLGATQGTPNALGTDLVWTKLETPASHALTEIAVTIPAGVINVTPPPSGACYKIQFKNGYQAASSIWAIEINDTPVSPGLNNVGETNGTTTWWYTDKVTQPFKVSVEKILTVGSVMGTTTGNRMPQLLIENIKCPL